MKLRFSLLLVLTALILGCGSDKKNEGTNQHTDKPVPADKVQQKP